MTRATRHSDPPRTLAKYAVTSGGPPYRKARRYPLYHPDDLDDWVGRKLSNPVTSTSELSNQQSVRELGRTVGDAGRRS
jgi:hypothetical protein